MDKIVNTLQPDISVVMSVYNAEKYLREAIDSILQQSFREFEFIIVNDGSKDGSLSIIQSYNDPRIRLIDNEGNKGLIYSLNTAFKSATGKYIARMDADDISLPQRLAQQFAFMEANPSVGVCSCNYTQFNAEQETAYTAFTDHNEVFATMFFNCSVVHPSLMLRKASLMECDLLFDEKYKYAEDYELWSRLLFKCRFSAVPQTLLRYRLHNQQVTQKNHEEQLQSANRIREHLLKRSGFVADTEELRVHNRLGNSQRIHGKEDLFLLHQWFKKIIEANRKSELIEPRVFEQILCKQWFDACGITDTGLTAFFIYLRSDLRDKANESLTKLFVKCLLRKFK